MITDRSPPVGCFLSVVAYESTRAFSRIFFILTPVKRSILKTSNRTQILSAKPKENEDVMHQSYLEIVSLCYAFKGHRSVKPILL